MQGRPLRLGIVWPRNERLLMTLQIKRMRLKRGQETPFHRLLRIPAIQIYPNFSSGIDSAS
uniref:Uncharacterized protein n=1 Tax=Salix viminalis TaxID=40686 RepID=A0A6N2LI10_SALVM